MAERRPERLLIYRLGSLGDTIVALPALHLIQRAFPSAERRMLTNVPVHAKAPAAASVLEHTGLVHGFFLYSVGIRNPFALLALWWQIVRWRPEILVYAGSSRGTASARRDACFFRLCGIRRLIGIPTTQDMQQPRRERLSGGVPALEAEAARLARNLVSLGDARLDDPASWNLHLTPAEHARAAEVLAPIAAYPLIAVSVGTKVQAKDWGGHNWRSLLAQLAESYPGHALALCGALEEVDASEFAAAGWRARSNQLALNLCGLLTPRESAAVFAQAAAFLGHDSGPMHLASAVGTPCTAIFAARTLPRVWFPYGPSHRVLYHHVACAGCKLETCIVEQKRCLTSITVPEVLAAFAEVLSSNIGPTEMR